MRLSNLYTLVMMAALVTIVAACRGPQGVQGPLGNTGHAGTNGQDGSNGTNGTDGHDGATGPQGPQGPAGHDGTVITPVKFCSETASYPSTFPEYGFCINGSIYAVYSANDGFLTIIPDGTYHSNAVGSACTFTVSGCTITEIP